MYKVVKSLKGYKPLAYVGEKLLLSRGYSLFFADHDLNNLYFFCEIPVNRLKKVLSKFRLCSRVLRLGVSSALDLENGYILLVCRDIIWKVDQKNRVIDLDFNIPEGKTALYLSMVSSPNTEKKYVCFGEYFSNPEKSPVNIWRKDISGCCKWEIIHTFGQDCINHVHNIISSPFDDTLLVLTGDFGDGAAIWSCSKSFTSIDRILSGNQNVRACWVSVRETGFVYATDTQLDRNFVFSFDGASINKIGSVAGSSIYFSQMSDDVFFSTAVEPGEPTGKKLGDMFCTQPGPGIESDISYIYSLNKDDKLDIVFSAKKDFIPMRLGQFGSFMFPSGVSQSNSLIAYAVALKKYDDCCLLLDK